MIRTLLVALGGLVGGLLLVALGIVLFFVAGRALDVSRQAARVRAAQLDAARDGQSRNPETVVLDDEARLDQIQLIATHNSSHVRADPLRLFLIGLAAPGEPAKLRYTHEPLWDQLAGGIRSMELDVRNRVSRFIVSHVPLVDDRATCPDFSLALEELRLWSERTPDHVLIIVLLELKDDMTAALPGIEPFDGAALDRLDAEIRDAFPERQILKPDDVRGSHASLEAAILDRGWPTVGQTRGKLMFILHQNDRQRELFIAGNPTLAGRMMFTCAPPGSPDAAVLLMNDPIAGSPRIGDLTARHYLVRTRADADLSVDPRRFDAALASGAQIISTDFPPSERPHETGYTCAFPGLLTARRTPTPRTTRPGA